MSEILWQKTYQGFEDVYDLERDISEMWEEQGMTKLDSEFQDTLVVTITRANTTSE